MTLYAIYQGDKFLDLGTKEEMAEKFGIKPETVRFLASPAKRRRDKRNNQMIAERIEVDW